MDTEPPTCHQDDVSLGTLNGQIVPRMRMPVFLDTWEADHGVRFRSNVTDRPFEFKGECTLAFQFYEVSKVVIFGSQLEMSIQISSVDHSDCAARDRTLRYQTGHCARPERWTGLG